jgi:hypothetical protein
MTIGRHFIHEPAKRLELTDTGFDFSALARFEVASDWLLSHLDQEWAGRVGETYL